jgi:hypothetical protein
MPILLSPYAVYQHSTTGVKLVKAALRKLGAIASGEEINGNELADALEEINRMLDNWNTEELLVHVVNRNAYTISAAITSLEIGPGGNLDQVRPQRIEAGQPWISEDSLEYPITVWQQDRWASIVDKSITGRPYILYYEAKHPLGVINLWPVTDKSYDFIIYTWNLLSQISNINQAMAFPPGYADAIVYELAIRLAPEYGKAVPPAVAIAAVQTKANVKRINSITPELRVDNALLVRRGRGRYDIKSGGWIP